MNFFTEIKEGLGIAWNAILANKLRSILTTLGIIIGVGTVTLMSTAIDSLNQAFHTSISILGADTLYVSRMGWFVDSAIEWEKMARRPYITHNQARELVKQLSEVRGAAPRVGTMQPVRYRNKFAGSVFILGTTDQFLEISGFSVAEGRFISQAESDGGRPVCVIGLGVATNLFPIEPAIGKQISVGARRLEVIGVLEKQGSFLGLASLDNQVIIPIQQLLTGYNRDPDFLVMVKATNVIALDSTEDEVRGVMRKIRHTAPGQSDDFSINRQEMFVKAFDKVAGTIAAVGLLITSLSLFVGGIGIMNIMFVSVAERTREIGVRKAIGARRSTILLQFLIEAATICLLGGLVGMAISFGITFLISHFMFTMTMSMPVMGLAILVSLITGVASGFFPAWRAARMDPVEALRNE